MTPDNLAGPSGRTGRDLSRDAADGRDAAADERPPLIYLDNAATTCPKPPQVARAVAEALDAFGGAGRGVHPASTRAGLAVHRCRRQIAELLGAPDPRRVCFALNATEALNTVIAGLVGPGDRAVTTAASHNSVLRPLNRAADERSADVAVLPVAPDGGIDYAELDRLLQVPTRLLVVTHASNLTGDVYDVARMAEIAHAHGALVCVDAAQTAGCYPIDMAADRLDIVCFTGHKGLFGPQGTGGVALAPGVDVPALKEGGSGARSYDRRQPDVYPERLEAGTLNAHGIAGLAAGVSYIQEQGGPAAVHERVEALTLRLEQGVRAIAGVTVYGGHADVGRCGIVALNVGDLDSGTVADALADGFGICVRAGAHCAPLMHEALGTSGRGAVRLSLSALNTVEQVDAAVGAIAEIASLG